MAKLTSPVKRFIYIRKRLNPQITCAALKKAIQKKFNIHLAKTTIHLYLKKKNKNIRRGRPRYCFAYRGKPPSAETSNNMGTWFLKAADLSFGGVEQFTKTLSEKFKLRKQDALWKNEALLYAPIFGMDNDFWQLIGKTYSPPKILKYKQFLESIKTIGFEAFSSFSSSLTGVSFLKFNLADGTFFILDGKLQSIYTIKPDIEEFSLAINKAKDYINKIFYKKETPLILLSLPGYEYPPKILFDFISSFNGETGKAIKKISLYSQGEEELSRFAPLESTFASGGRPLTGFKFIAAIWPWQYKNVIKIEAAKKFLKLRFGPLNEEFNLGEGLVSLANPETLKIVRMRVVILTTVRARHTLPLLITNIPKKNLSGKRIALRYLERFPNLEEGYKVYSSRISAKTYVKFSELKLKREFLPKIEEYNLSAGITLDEAFQFWRDSLAGFCKLHFFPEDLQKMDFSELKEKIFSLPGQVKKIGKYTVVELQPPKDYPYKKALAFACQRVNESNILTNRNRRVWFKLI